jgi:hypothetical protein
MIARCFVTQNIFKKIMRRSKTYSVNVTVDYSILNLMIFLKRLIARRMHFASDRTMTIYSNNFLIYASSFTNKKPLLAEGFRLMTTKRACALFLT